MILGAAYLLDSPALLLLGILLAPLLTPWAGMTLAIMTGSWGFFFLTLGGLAGCQSAGLSDRGAGRVGRASLAALAAFPCQHSFAFVVAGFISRGVGCGSADNLVRPF